MSLETMWALIGRGVVAGAVVVAVSELGVRSPRLGALVLTLPLVSIVAFIATWMQHGEVIGISRLARETLVLVPLGLPFFIPLALADRWGLSFWTAFAAGVLLASATIGLWWWRGPAL